MDKETRVGICDTQPIIVEGVKSALKAQSALGHQPTNLKFYGSAPNLETLTALVKGQYPDVLILDGGWGARPVLDWITTALAEHPLLKIIVWAYSFGQNGIADLLKMGVKGVMLKTADVPTMLSCLYQVSMNGLWIDESLIQRGTVSRKGLTAREQQVLELVEEGRKTKDIATRPSWPSDKKGNRGGFSVGHNRKVSALFLG